MVKLPQKLLLIFQVIILLVACQSTQDLPPTQVSNEIPPPQAGGVLDPLGNNKPLAAAASYFLLRERPPAIIQINRQDNLEQYIFPLDSPLLDNGGLEGITFVSNQEVLQYGLFDLPPSENGGYFITAAQSSGRLHIFDVPISTSRDAVEVGNVIIPDLNKDATALQYENGSIWVMSAVRQSLFQIATVYVNGQVNVRHIYRLKELPQEPKDIEGIAIKEGGVAFIAEDNPHLVYRLDNFPICLENYSCTRIWERSFGDDEPSGAVWDVSTSRLLLVDDEGHFFSVDENGESFVSIFLTAEDLEGVTIVPTTD